MKNAKLTLCALLGLTLAHSSTQALMELSCYVPERVETVETYTVESERENLWTISDKIYGSRKVYDPLDEKTRRLPSLIAKANGIKAPYYIHKGQRLYIPHEKIISRHSGVCSASGRDPYIPDFKF